MSKRGQATIFIIVAIIIVAIIALFIIIKSIATPSGPGVSAEENPSEYLRVCLEDTVKQKVDIIMHQGGSLENPSNISFRFNNEARYYDISYLCYNRINGLCVNQEPNLIKHVEKEISEGIEEDFRTCFRSLINNLEKSGYEVDSSAPYDFNLKLKLKTIEITSDEEIQITKNEQKRELNKIRFSISEKELYKLLVNVDEIVDGKASSCNFDYFQYMLNHPGLNVQRTLTMDGVEIFTIKNYNSNRFFRFAVRGIC